MPRSRALVPVAAVALLGLLLSGCTAEPMPVPTPSPSSTPTPAGDGILRLGTLFPTKGTTAFLARAQDAGVELAVREINEAGGVLGQKVEVFHRDSGDASATTAEDSLKALIEKEVDVVIGPSSSVIAERILPTVMDAGMAMISSSATSPVLTGLPDNGRLFRTIPSAALQGAALAGIAGADKTVALIYYSDASGRAVHDALVAGLEEHGNELAVDEAFTETTNSVDRIATAITKADPDMIVLVSPFSAMAKNKEILTRLAKEKLAGSRLWLTSQNLADYSQALPAGMLKDANGILEGVSPDADFTKRVKSADPAVTDFRYAAEAYDATILAALAAIVAGDDSGAAVARALRDVSSGGIKCLSFAECLDVLRTQSDIDYDGVSGPLTLDEHGDPHPAEFGLYRYEATNKYKLVGSTVAG